MRSYDDVFQELSWNALIHMHMVSSWSLPTELDHPDLNPVGYKELFFS